MVIPDLEPLEEAVEALGAWRARAKALLAGRPTLAQLKAAVEEAAAMHVRSSHARCSPQPLARGRLAVLSPYRSAPGVLESYHMTATPA